MRIYGIFVYLLFKIRLKIKIIHYIILKIELEWAFKICCRTILSKYVLEIKLIKNISTRL